MCKIKDDDKFYHLVPSPSIIFTQFCTPEFLDHMAHLKTYCDNEVSALPHEWCVADSWGINNPYKVDFTWGHLKPCPICQKRREEQEREAWHF